MEAQEYIKSRMEEHNIRNLVDQLDAIYQGELIALMESYAQSKNEAEIRETAQRCVFDYAQYLIHLLDNPWEESKPVGIWFDEWYKKQ